MAHRLSTAALLAALLLGMGGCASSSVPPGERAGASGPSERLLDSLRAANQRLRETRATLRDSLRFRRDVETGRYYRERRNLRDRIERMSYDLARLREGGHTIEVIEADALFEPASARLTPSGRTRLDTLGARIERTYPERRLLVEGHADGAALSDELQETYPSNWELSALRAASVVRYLTAEAGLAKERFRLSAFADTQPVASNQAAAGRRQNRRVRVAALPEPRASAGADAEPW